MLLTKKFENDFEQAENILKLAEYFVVNLPKDNINFYSYITTPNKYINKLSLF